MVKARMRYTSGATEGVSCPLSLPSSFSSQIQVEQDRLQRRKVNTRRLQQVTHFELQQLRSPLGL